MELLDYLRRLFDYDAWANGESLASLREVQDPPQRSRKFIAHVLAAEWLWLRRLKTGKQIAVWPDLTLEQCARELQELNAAWAVYLSQLTPGQLANEISYTNTKGENWRSTIADVLMHVVMHSAYHRGQVASDMRQSGHTPAYTDFIHCVRRGLLSAK
jgi:uncharacterized damage-inducible protein DinB